MQATLPRRVKKKNKKINGVMKGLGQYRSTFNAELEIEIVKHVKLLDSRLYGLILTQKNGKLN